MPFVEYTPTQGPKSAIKCGLRKYSTSPAILVITLDSDFAEKNGFIVNGKPVNVTVMIGTEREAGRVQIYPSKHGKVQTNKRNLPHNKYSLEIKVGHVAQFPDQAERPRDCGFIKVNAGDQRDNIDAFEIALPKWAKKTQTEAMDRAGVAPGARPMSAKQRAIDKAAKALPATLSN